MPVSARNILVSATMAVLLAGCGAVAPQGRTVPIAEIAIHTADPQTRRRPEVKPEVPEDARRLAAAERAAAAIPPPPSRPSFPRVEERVLVGMTPEDALLAFGRPAYAQRRDGGDPLGATSWIYEASGCRLEIDFHFSVADNTLRASTHRIDSSDPLSEIPASICLHALARARPNLTRSPTVAVQAAF